MRTATLSLIAISIASGLWSASIPAAGQERSGAQAHEPRIRMQFRNQNITEVIDLVAKQTGRAFIYDDTVRGRITITGDALVTLDEAFAILEATLSVQGLAILPTPGGPAKIIKLNTALATAPWNGTSLAGEGEAPITTMVHLRHARTNLVITTLQQLVGTNSIALEYPETNALILVGREGQVRRLLSIVHALDQEDFDNLIILNLRYADATQTADQIDYAINNERNERPPLRVWSDERTNSLLLLASPAVLAQARTLIDKIDRPAEGRGDILVVPIRHVDPETLSEELNALGARGPEPSDDDEGLHALNPLQGRLFNLVVDAPTRSLLIMSDPETTGLLLEVIDKLDRMVPRISLEVIVSEIDAPSSYRLGFAAFVPLGSQEPGSLAGGAILIDPSGGGLQSQGDATTSFVGRASRTPLEVPVLANGVPVLDADGNPITIPFARESAVIVAGQTQVTSKVLIRPSLLMTSGEQREVFVGDNIPIPIQNAASESVDPLVVSQSIERQDVGVTLRATPTLGLEGGVHLALEVEIRQVIASVAGDVAAVGPTIQQRNITTTMQLRDGEIMVAGGFTGTTISESVRGVPWLMDIPFIGWLFKDTSKISRNTTHVIAAQVRILRNNSDLLAESIRRRLGFERALERVEALESESPYAVLVTTRSSEDEAAEIAERLTTESQTAVVSGWEGLGQRLYDVYLTGYERIEDAGDAAIRIRVDGWTPEVVALPPR